MLADAGGEPGRRALRAHRAASGCRARCCWPTRSTRRATCSRRSPSSPRSSARGPAIPLLDPLAALVVVGFIGYAGFDIARDASGILADRDRDAGGGHPDGRHGRAGGARLPPHPDRAARPITCSSTCTSGWPATTPLDEAHASVARREGSADGALPADRGRDHPHRAAAAGVVRRSRSRRSIDTCIGPTVLTPSTSDLAARSVPDSSARSSPTSADVADHHRLVDRLDHVVDRERGDGDGRQRFHLDAGLPGRADARLDARSRRASASSSTSTCVSGSGWQSGISVDVRLAAMMPASRAVWSGSPFFTVPARISRSAARRHRDRARAPRLRARSPPCRRRRPCGRARARRRATAGRPASRLPGSLAALPCARKNDRLSSDTVRSTLFSLTSGRHLQRAGREVQHRLDAGRRPPGRRRAAPTRPARRSRRCRSARARTTLLQLLDVVDRHAAARSLADLARRRCRTARRSRSPPGGSPG